MKKAKTDADNTTPKESVTHSEEVNTGDKKGYNETNQDAPVNSDQNQKDKAKKMKRELPSASENN